MQRSSVDLPDPDAPIRQTTSCSATVRSMPRSTSSAPNDLCSPSMRSASTVIGAPPAEARSRSRVATSQSVNRASGMVNDDEHEGDAQERGPVERRLLLDAGRSEDLDDPDERDEDRVLLEPDEVVEERGHDPSDGLGQDDVAHRLGPRQPERTGRRLLARVDRLDARLGRPRRRTPNRRASGRTPPRRTAHWDARDEPGRGPRIPARR